MRYLLFALVLVLLVSATALSQPVVVLDTLTGGLCGLPAASFTSLQVISICNPDTLQYNLDLAFKIQLVSGASIRSEDIQVEFYNGLEDYFKYHGQSTVLYSSVTPVSGGFVVTVATWDLPGTPEEWGISGLPVSSDTIPYISIRFRPSGGDYGSYICFESATTTEIPVWVMNSGVYPAFGGGRCYDMHDPLPSCCTAAITYGPHNYVVNNACETVRATFMVDEGVGFGSIIELYYGPGAIRRISHATFEYEWRPTGVAAGDTVPVILRPGDDICGDGSYVIHGEEFPFTIIIGDGYVPGDDDPVQFAYPQQSRFVATTGDTLKVNLQTDDDGPCTDYWYSQLIFEQEPPPVHGWLDSLTGTYYYVGESADTGTYWIYEIVHDGPYADTTLFTIQHYENSLCGDLDRDGTVTMGDLTYLISTLFIDLLPPAPPEAGNVDCEPGITMGDLTFMIDHLFITLSPMCNCL